ncbi:MotA/TolQ/ExbB proton channel family protein [Methylosoma difficile]
MPYQLAPEMIAASTLYILLSFSIITWTLILFKTWQFAANSLANKHFNQVFWDAPNLAEAEALPDSTFKGSQAKMARQGFKWLNESREQLGKNLKYSGVPSELLEHALLEQLQKEQRSLENGLTLLASIGSTAPFVGLFGTVLGIMHAMHQITESGSTSLDVVAGPIGDALVATAIGIAVAVPAVLAYNFFLRRAKHQRAEMENFLVSFSHVVFNNPDKGNL